MLAPAEASATVTETAGNVPNTVGVPLRRPAVLIDSPAGRPVADHEYVFEPPVAAKVVEV